LGIEAVTMYHTKPLSYHDINLGTLSYSNLVYEILDYDLGNTDIDRIKSIQKIKIGNEEIDKFNIYLVSGSLYIEIDEEYRFLLSPSSSSLIQAQFYEVEPQGISLTFDSNNIKWLLETLAYGYFDISYHLPGINQGDQFLFWFNATDGLKNIISSKGNQFISREYKGIYDNIISGTSDFEWDLGETSSSEGILIFGSENYGDSTIKIDISSILFDENSDVDVQRIMIYGSTNGIVYTILDRAYFSDDGVWSYYWDYELGVEDPVDYYLKAYIFDKAGNYLSITHDVKLYDYNAIVLLTDLVFGDIIEFDDSLPSNIYDFTGTFYLQNTPLNLWDVVGQYYNPLDNNWVPLYADPAVIQTYGPNDGSYTITWDINQDIDFLYTMYNFTYEFLPLRVAPTTSNNIWGSWGVFDLTGEWKPIILLDTASQIDIIIYEFDSVNGWIVDTALSSQDPINVITEQVFKIFDINGDGIDEIISVSPFQVDVIYLDQSSNWVIKEDTINEPELQYSIFDLTFNEVSQETTVVLFQLNLTSGSTELGKYYFNAQYNLIQSQRPAAFISNLIPHSINIVENLFSTTSVLVGAFSSESSLSQLIHYDFNLENEDILDNYILGRITSIEAETINGIKTIVLGISRTFIGKMDTVICLKFNTELDSWVKYEINDFDENRLKIYDMIFIKDKSLNKLIISTDSGLFRSTIEYIEEQNIITDPIKFTTATYSYDELNTIYWLSGTRFIITEVRDTPIYQINKIFHKTGGIWYELADNQYYITHSRYAFDLQLDSFIWNILTDLKIAYSFISNKDEVRHSIDPSFNTYGSTSTVSDISASSKFFDDSSLPLLWLNPTSTITDPFADWRSLENLDWNYRGVNYRYLPVSSGLGTSVLYPTITNPWTSEYITLPELENSLIYYGNNGYDSGILSQYLTGEDDLLGEDEFGGEFSGNYRNNVYISNPIISESFDFADLYYDSIHSVNSIYDDAGSIYANDVLVRNRMVDYDFTDFVDSDSGLSSTGSLPSSSIYQYLSATSLKEIEYILSDRNNYLSLKMEDTNVFGAEFTYELPVIDRAGLNSIQVAFDASIASSSFNNEYPISLRIYNDYDGRWESLPIAPITTSGFYNSFTLDYEFWANWDSLSDATSTEFRPSWGTTDSNNYNTISFGINYPYEVIDGNVLFDPQFDPTLGANFLDTSGSENHDLNTYWSFNDEFGGQHHKLLYYDTSFNSNKFQFDNIIIDPDNFYTSSSPFPDADPSTGFSNSYSPELFYDRFLNDNNELKLQLIVDKEAGNPDAYLCIGDFKTYVHTDSNYLNYEDFDSNVVSTLPMQHVSDEINLNPNGLELRGESGFNIRQNYNAIPIFQETFEDNLWTLDASNPTIYLENIPTDDAVIVDGWIPFPPGGGPGGDPGHYPDIVVGTNRQFIPIGNGIWVEGRFEGVFKSEYPYLDLSYISDSVMSYYGTSIGDPVLIDVKPFGDFNENTVSWTNQPETGPLQAQFYPSLGRQEQNIGAPSSFYKLSQQIADDEFNYEFVMSSKDGNPGEKPNIKHYLSKFHQGGGIAYMQTDISENLNLRSPIYPSITNMEIDDVFVIEFRTTSANEIRLNLFNGGQQLQLDDDFIVVPDLNTNFNKQIYYITLDTAITFDEIEFSGNLNDPENFIVYDIKALRQGQTEGVFKDSRNYDFLEQLAPRFPLINYGRTISGSPSSAHLSDNNYWSITSADDKVSIDFLFESESDVQDFDKFEIYFEASGSIALDGNIEFSYYNYILGDFEPLPHSYSLIDNNFVLILNNYDFNTIKDPIDSQYRLLLKTVITDNNPFTVTIDSLNMKALEVWSAEHDLYKASFEFKPYNSNGEIRLFLNRDIYTVITDSQYNVGQTHIVSFYYDTNSRVWYIYLDDTLLSGPIDDPNPLGLTPRIESNFLTDLEYIEVFEVSSQYFMKVETQNDFENYKTLVNSYKEGSFTDSFTIDSLDSLLIAENTFSQISSDIDIIYNFKDGITENNIFNKNLTHSENSSYSDSLETIPYNYQEEIVLPSTSIDPTKDYVTAPLLGTKYQVTGGNLADLQSDDDFNTITMERDAYTNHEPSYSPHAPIEGYNSVRGYPRRPIFTSSSPQSDHLYFTGTSGGFSVRIDEVDGNFWSQFDDGWISSTTQYAYNMDHYKIRTNWFNTYTWIYEEMVFDTKYNGLNPTNIDFEFKIKVDIISDNGNGANIEIQNPSTQNWVTINMLTNDDQFHSYYYTLDSASMDTYVDDDGNIKIRIVSYAREFGVLQTGTIEIWTDVARCIVEYLPESKVQFVAGTTGNNYYLSYEGKTTGSAMNFYVNDVSQFQIGTSWNQHEEILVMDLSNLYIILGELNQGWISDRILENDYLYLIDINQATSIPIYNTDTVSLASMSKHFNTTQSSWLEDPFLGPTMQYTLENTVITPIFGRAPEPIHTQLELDSLELEFDVFPSIDSTLLEDGDIEGKDANLYNEGNYDYTGRLKNTALDDIHIPLISPIELDFGQLETQGLSNIDLEIALDLDVSLNYRSISSPNWVLRSRLMMYDYQTSQWEDFTGILTTNDGTKTLWQLDSTFPSVSNLHYLQYPNTHQNLFMQIGDSTQIEIKATEEELNVLKFLQDGVVKLILLSYIIPGNFDSDPGNNLFYGREEIFTPVNISQSVNIKESALLVETTNNLYPESVFSTTLPLDSNYKADLSLLDPVMGEVVLVKGISEITPTLTEEYPLFNIVDFEVKDILTQPNIEIISSMKSEFTRIYIEYLPQLSLVSGPPWYLPSEYTKDNIKYESPFFISEVIDDAKYYGTYIYPTYPAGFTIEPPSGNQLYVDFTNPPPGNNPRGAIHFAKIDGKYSNRFSIKDELIFRSDLLELPTDLSGGKIHLTTKSGFNDIMDGTELTQIATNDYYITVKLYKLDRNGNIGYIGQSVQSIDSPTLGFSQHELEVDFITFDTSNGIQDIGDTLTQGYGNDLYITVETTISNCLVDAHLFRGHFAQQILDAQIEIESENTALVYNNIPVDTPYLELNHNNIQLDKIDENTYQFNSLKYYFDFEVIEVRTGTGTILNSADYYFNSFDNSISLNYEYSGLIFADIIYHAFKWGVNSISTLEPITMSFSEDFISKYTSYLELEIEFNFDGIPGFEIMNLDTSSGKVVMTNEEKNAKLLKLFLYNYKTETYDFIDCVVYDNYGESDNFLPTFSYIIDRNFIVFEDYFNDLGTTFDISFILGVDESFDNYFASKINFGINSINAKIYHDPPSVEQFLNPQIVFDIDLSEYYSIGFDLDEISLEFDYLTTILNDESSIFSQYALIEEDIVFSIQNKYLEFETFTLEDGTAFFSQKEINNLLIHDKENDKYFIRIKLEYEWHSIIKVNLGGTSRIEILSSVQLMKYNLNVKYTSTETVRISAFESSTPHDLAAIKAPNYFETDSGIIVFPDDTEVDIGLNSGFLRNIDTRQRLMIRQDLSYSFPDSQLGPIPILVDQSYSDTILRFKNPIGYLDSPTGIYLNNSKKFSYIAEFDVSTVELFWDDGTEHLVGQMVPNPLQPNRFEYEWKTIDVDTGITSGDTIDILIRLTDIFLATNDYHYYFEADFISPTPSISVGDGAQNFENNFASPLTDISFDNSITPSSELWNEPLSTYDPTQMSYNDYPDSYSKIWNMDPFNMLNLFPTISSFDDWSGWGAVNYNPTYTDSLFATGGGIGTFTSQLNYWSPSKTPDTFLENSGSITTNGDLSIMGGTPPSSIIDSSSLTFDYNYGTGNPEVYYQKWNEDFTSFQSYMTQSYEPDSRAGSYSMNPGGLNMQNIFPVQSSLDDWTEANWPLNFNSGYTTSSFTDNGNTGTLSSTLNAGSSSNVPNTFSNGPTTSGDLNNADGAFSTFISSDPSYYNGAEQLWGANFAAEQSYMTHTYDPDDHHSTYSVSGDLMMDNEIPWDAYTEPTAGWSVPNYDPSKTLSSYNPAGILSSNILSGNVLEPAIQSDFNFVDGKGEWVSYGNNLRDQDGSYSTIDTTTGGAVTTLVPNGDLVHNEWTLEGSGGGGHFSYIDVPLDNSNMIQPNYINNLEEEFSFTSFDIGLGSVYKIIVWQSTFRFGVGVRADVKLSWNNGGTWDAYDSSAEYSEASGFPPFTNYGYEFTGLNKDAAALSTFAVGVKSVGVGGGGIPNPNVFLMSMWVEVFYTSDLVQLEAEVTIDVPDPELQQIDSLEYAFRFQDPFRAIRFQIQNPTTEGWTNIYIGAGIPTTWIAGSYSLGASSPYVSGDFKVKTRFVILSGSESPWPVDIDQLALNYSWQASPGDWDADITKTSSSAVNTFLNRYDGFSSYKKLYDIEVSFNYQYTVDDSSESKVARFYFDSTMRGLNTDGLPHTFTETFQFDSASAGSFVVKFEVGNGDLQFDTMGYIITFKCIDTSDNIILQQTFDIDYPEIANPIPQFVQDNGAFFIDTDIDFTTISDGKTYYNKYGRTNKLEIIFNIYTDGAWRNNAYIYSTSSSIATRVPFDVDQWMTTNTYDSFEDFSVEYVMIGDSTNLLVNDLRLFTQQTLAAPILDTETTINIASVTGDDTIETLQLLYAYKTDNGQPIEMQIWNYNLAGGAGDWEYFDSTYSEFLPAHSEDIDLVDNIDINFNVKFRFLGTGIDIAQTFNFYIDQFRVDATWTRTQTQSDTYVPVQAQTPSGDFDLINGTSDFAGDLALSDGISYSTFDSTLATTPSGNFSGTYSFENDAHLTNGVAVSMIDEWTGNYGSYLRIYTQDGPWYGHNKTLLVTDSQAGGKTTGVHNFDNPQSSGTIEFWLLMRGSGSTGSTDRYNQIHFRSSDNTIAFRVQLKMLQGGYVSGDRADVEYYDGNSWVEFADGEDVTWYHNRIDFDCATDKYSWYIYEADGTTLLGSITDIDFENPMSTLDEIYFTSITSHYRGNTFWDAFGFTWEGYNVGDNLKDYTIGHFPGTYSFENDAHHTNGVAVSMLDEWTGNYGSYLRIYTKDGPTYGHNKTLLITDSQAGGKTTGTHNFDNPQSSGTIEFWLLMDGAGSTGSTDRYNQIHFR
ncbi:hypothetical protein LCGC14_0692870, partial [marine sediment metagenome]